MKKSKVRERTPVTILQLLEEKVNVDKLIRKIPLHEEMLVEAALENPSLSFEAGRFRIQKFHRKTQLETKHKLEMAKAGLALRRIRSAGGRKEHSEGAVRERIELNPRVRKVRRLLDRATAEEEMGKLLADVYRGRSMAITQIINAGKVSVHSKELAMLKANKTLNRGVRRLRDTWDKMPLQDNLGD